MSKRFKHIFAILVILICTNLMNQSFAASAIDGATEPTQIANNIELALQYAKQIEQYKKQIDQYKTQLLQYERQITDALNVDSALSGLSMSGLNQELGNVRQTQQAFDNLYGTLDNLERDWQARYIDAASMNLPIEDYFAREQDRIRMGNQNAIRRLGNEKRLLDDVEQDYALARQWGSSISGQEGINASLGLLNTQMNRMLQQNARISRILAQANGSDKAVEEQKKAEQEALTWQMTNKIQQDSNQNHDNVMNSINSLKIAPAQGNSN